MEQQSLDATLGSKRALCSRAIMSMERLGLIGNDDHARTLFDDMMRMTTAELEQTADEYELRVLERGGYLIRRTGK